MFKKNFHLLFIFFLILGTLVSISSNSWFLSWLGFEINVMSFIPLILLNINYKLTEASIKYFIIQALASTFLLIFFLMDSSFTLNTLFLSSLTMIFLSLSLKMGAAPLHMWFPQVAKKINWALILILFTWQKVAPLLMLTLFMKISLLPLIASLSAMVGALGGLNQFNTKIIFTYSSIAHSGWLIFIASLALKITILYFMMYSVMIIFIVWASTKFKFETSNKMSLNKINLQEKLLFSMAIMSLGGLPPFIGFSMKVISILFIMSSYSLIFLFILLLSSIISLMFYVKMFFPFITIFNFKLKKIPFLNQSKHFSIFSLSVILLNLLISFLILLT